MLLAAEADGNVEVLFADHASPGERVLPQGIESAEPPQEQIDIDTFFSIPLVVKDHVVSVAGKPLVCGGREITTTGVAEGTVG